jgi:hypothetical protein
LGAPWEHLFGTVPAEIRPLLRAYGVGTRREGRAVRRKMTIRSCPLDGVRIRAAQRHFVTYRFSGRGADGRFESIFGLKPTTKPGRVNEWYI